jgi:spermidine synthase
MQKKRKEIIDYLDGIGVSFRNLSLLYFDPKGKRKISIYQHSELGKIFVLDNEIQHVEAWAPLYHEPLVHLPCAFLKEVRDVLILGGGTLFAAKEVLKYQTVKRVILMDYDSKVIQATASLYPHATYCLRDPRFKHVQCDAYSSITNHPNKYDLIINDALDLLDIKWQITNSSQINHSFGRMAKLLKKNGVCVDVVQRHLFEKDRIQKTLRHLHIFRTAMSLVHIPEFHGVLHVLTIWGNNGSKIKQNLKKTLNKEQLVWSRNFSSLPCEYYNPNYLKYYLYLPPYLKKNLPLKKSAL